jgi:hypothetical protein
MERMLRMRKIKKACLLILLGILTLTNAVLAASQMPSDITGHWAEADIKAAAEEGWAYMENGEFAPNKAATREEVVWMLIGKCNLIMPDGYDENKRADLSEYKDEPSAWAKDRLAVAIGNGYITGYLDNTISAQKPITRAELAVLLSRLIRNNVPATQLPFSDTIPEWSADGIKKAYAMKIIQGYNDGTFAPNNNVKKAEALSMIKRWADGGKTSDEPVEDDEKGLVEGQDGLQDAGIPDALSAEDEKRLMEEYPIGKDGPYYRTSKEFKEQIGNYQLYLQAAEDHVELVENYNYKEIATEAGKKKYLAGFEKYTPYTGSFLKREEASQLSFITEEKLIKEADFVINDNCIFSYGGGITAVRGVLYFKFEEIGGTVRVHSKEVKPGIQYKVDIEMWLSGHPYYTEPTQIKVNQCGYISDPTEVIMLSGSGTAALLRQVGTREPYVWVM